MSTRICVAEFLCCSPETITVLLIGYTSIQKKIKNKKELVLKTPEEQTCSNFQANPEKA